MTKFTDPTVLDKLNKALNEVVCKDLNNKSTFTLSPKEGNSEIAVAVTVGLSNDVREKLTSTCVGRIHLPKPLETPIEPTKTE